MADRMTAVAKLPDAIRALAEVIRKHGTCAPAALDHVADELTAALSPAELGGVEAVAWLWLHNGEPINALLRKPSNADLEYGTGKGYTAQPLYTTPRAAEAVSEEMVERACNAYHGWWKYPEHIQERPRLRVAMRAALTASLTPPSAKGE